MLKILILAAIAAACVRAQTEDDRWPNAERGNLRVNSDPPRVNRDEGNIRNTPSQGNTERNVGGFQNGNFARTDGRLRTNLNSGRNLDEHPGENSFRPAEGTYLVEGAAFRGQEGRQQDAHSSRGRVGDDSPSDAEGSYENRRSRQHFENEEATRRDDQRKHDTNVHNEENVKNDGNGSSNQNTQDDNNERTNYEHTYRQGDDGNDTPNSERSDNQSSHETNNQGRSRGASGPNIDSRAKSIDSRAKSIDSRAKSIADKVTNHQQNLDREAMEREINNQITKMIYKASTEPDANNTKPARENEVPPRSGSGGQGDRWIWSDGSEATSATSTVVPTVDDRAAFAGDQCPTGQVKFNNVCVDED